MRILTVRQPWAWAIINGGKDVENRVRNIAGDYRGPVAIHVGLEYDTAWSSPPMFEAMKNTGAHRSAEVYPWHSDHGSIIGVVDLVEVHSPAADLTREDFCQSPMGDLCSAWAQIESWHLVLANPRALGKPIPYRGALGLRRLDDDTTTRILAQIGEPA